ncbi:MAG: YihY/virulence factor BrkB family protein [Geodermatophilaceae bacterium]|nr:YihY/virulence factor BrkB family protein [Geodermatophilaceae bacterium]
MSTDVEHENGRNAANQDPPGADAERPSEIPRQGWFQVMKRAFAEGKKDNVSMLAAGLAYFAFLALFPALIAAVLIYGLVADPADVQEQIDSLSGALPPEAKSLISDQMSSIASSSGGALGIGLAISLLGALWSVSGGVNNLINAVNVCYDEDETRGFLRLRGLALLLTVGGILFMALAVGLVAVAPVVLDALNLGTLGTILLQVGRWVLLVLLVVVGLAVVYRIAPDRDAPKFRWVSVGAAVATVIWVIASVGFSLYVSNFSSYGKTYGALAGVIVLLLWFFISAYIVLLGAEINAEAEQQTAQDTTKGPERPMGQRDAVKADSMPGGDGEDS